MGDSAPKSKKFYAIIETIASRSIGPKIKQTYTVSLKAQSEQEAIDELQSHGYNEFEILESVGRYRKKQIVELEKY